jgi:gliding motility-associated-like protein
MKKLILMSWLLTLAILPNVLHAQIPTNGMVAKYLFSGNANDESGNNINGMVFGPTLTLDRCSNPNSAYHFNGDYQYISLPPEKFLLNEYTYAAWIKVSSFPQSWDDGWMIFSPGSSNSGMCQGFSIHTLGEICGISYNIGNNPHGSWAVTPPIETEKWFHVAYTRSFSVLKVYINGVLMPYRHTDIYSPYPNNQMANYGDPDYTALIGCRSNFKSDDYFNGDIDDLYIYNRPLSNEEVLELYKSDCDAGTIKGIQQVCAGQENVSYSYPALPGYTNFVWEYSGKNVELTSETNRIVINFSDTATSGTISLVATGNGMDTITSQFSVAVEKLPGEAGQIFGDSVICIPRSGVEFQINPVPFATSYNWNYTGNGVQISETSNTISMDLFADATDGRLTVSGINSCGQGAISPELLIIANALPSSAGPISGESEFCFPQNDVKFEISPIPYATSYDWIYTGIGAHISGNNNEILMDFLENATDGRLTVAGINSCGQGITSPVMMIHAIVPPLSAGPIHGANEACLNSGNNLFSISEINSADTYVWEYSGEGATIVANSENAELYFFNNATSGNLTVYATNKCGVGSTSEEFPIIVKSCDEHPDTLNIPNAFSPNGDGINDLFVIRGLSSQSQLLIFDRSGKKQYESDDYQNNWNGKDSEGKIMESGTYWYVLVVSGIQNEYKGFVYLKK